MCYNCPLLYGFGGLQAMRTILLSNEKWNTKMEKQAEVITSDVAEYKDSSQSRCYNKKK